MFLGIDIGNSNIVLGIFYENEWQKVYRLPTKEKMTLPNEFLEKYLPHIKNSALISVVPSITPQVLDALAAVGIMPFQVNRNCFQYLDIQVNNEAEIGMDLVANAVESHLRFPNEDKIIIDFGTALTFTTISETGQILGVAIAPGIKTAMYALFVNAEQLFEVPLVLPSSVLGKDTVHALQAGVLFGYVGLVEGMIAQIRKEMKAADCKVLATGGLAFVLEPLHQHFDVLDVHLTLNGIRNIFMQASEKI
jgi:type III pantothenate kinase